MYYKIEHLHKFVSELIDKLENEEHIQIYIQGDVRRISISIHESMGELTGYPLTFLTGVNDLYLFKPYRFNCIKNKYMEKFADILNRYITENTLLIPDLYFANVYDKSIRIVFDTYGILSPDTDGEYYPDDADDIIDEDEEL